MRGAMEHGELFEAKFDFLAERYVELMNHLIAFDQSASDSVPFPEPVARKLHPDDLKGFSQLLEAINNHIDGKEDSGRDLFKKQVNLLMSNSTPDIELLRHPLIDPGYVFSDEWIAADGEIAFKHEFFAVMWFFLKSEGGDPQVDFALTKALFQLGKVIGRYERDGYTDRDRTSVAGSTPHKSKVTHEEVIQEAKEVSKKIKSDRNIARIVRKRLLKKEVEKENPMEVYSKDRIRKIWIKYKKDIG
jgi:hypothetical protein